jgi:chromosome segregation ATPase
MAAVEWRQELESLEAKVRQAAARLAELREENRGLARKVEALEKKLTAGVAAPSADALASELARERRRSEELEARLRELESQVSAAPSDGGPGSREREEIRDRVERLARRLEGLLAD